MGMGRGKQQKTWRKEKSNRGKRRFWSTPTFVPLPEIGAVAETAGTRIAPTHQHFASNLANELRELLETRPPIMKRAVILLMLLILSAAVPVSAANSQLLVQSNLATPAMNVLCPLRGCQVTQTVTGTPNNFFVLSVPSAVNLQFLET